MKQFIELLISRFDLGVDKNRVALVQFSSTSAVIFYLDTYLNQSKAVIYSTIDNLNALADPEQNTYTALGLR